MRQQIGASSGEKRWKVRLAINWKKQRYEPVKWNERSNLFLSFCPAKNRDVLIKFSSGVSYSFFFLLSQTQNQKDCPALTNSILSEESNLSEDVLLCRKKTEQTQGRYRMREGGRKGERNNEWYEVIGWCWKRKLELHVRMCVFYTWGHSWTISVDGCWTSCPAAREMTGLFACTA